MRSISWVPEDWLVGLREDISWVIRLVTHTCTDMGRVNKKDGVAPSNTDPIFFLFSAKLEPSSDSSCQSEPSLSLAQILVFIPIRA